MLTLKQAKYLYEQHKLWRRSALRFIKNESCFVDLNHQKSHNGIVRRIGFVTGGKAEW